MEYGRADYEWSHTAALMALMCNINKDKNTPMFYPNHFHPLHIKQSNSGDIRINKENKEEVRTAVKGLGLKKARKADDNN